MRTLLTFTGSVICFVVMTVISPLLLTVYTGLGVTRFLQSVQWTRPVLPSLHVKLPTVHMPAKRQWYLLWQKAVRFHN